MLEKNIEYSNFSNKFKSALVMAVPYDKQLAIKNYFEEAFESSISKARESVNSIL